VRRAIRELVRGKLQHAIREVLEEHGRGQRQWWQAQQAQWRAASTDERQQWRNSSDARRDEQHQTLLTEVTRLRTELHELEVRARRDIYYAGEIAASAESAAFALEHMPTVPTFPHPEATLKYAARLVTIPGSVLEFGVATGRTLRLLVEELPDRTIAGFDVFTGLPEDWRTGFPAGAFAQDSLPKVPGAQLVVGLFEETLPAYLAKHTEQVALLHLDADLYSATQTVLKLVGPRLVEGSVVLFDEYFNYVGWQHGEYLAWQEFVAEAGLTFDYAGYTHDHEQVVVVVTKAPAADCQ
jgi:Macrocin-O-methyltransferase (TylF)